MSYINFKHVLELQPQMPALNFYLLREFLIQSDLSQSLAEGEREVQELFVQVTHSSLILLILFQLCIDQLRTSRMIPLHILAVNCLWGIVSGREPIVSHDKFYKPNGKKWD